MGTCLDCRLLEQQQHDLDLHLQNKSSNESPFLDRLLSLPAEIRILIYREIFRFPLGSTFQLFDADNLEEYDFESLQDKPWRYPLESMVGIQATNRLLAAESSPYMFLRNHFWFEAPVRKILNLLKKIPQQRRRAIADLGFMGLTTTIDAVAFEMEPWWEVTDMITEEMDVKKLTLQIPSDPYFTHKGISSHYEWIHGPGVISLTTLFIACLLEGVFDELHLEDVEGSLPYDEALRLFTIDQALYLCTVDKPWTPGTFTWDDFADVELFAHVLHDHDPINKRLRELDDECMSRHVLMEDRAGAFARGLDEVGLVITRVPTHDRQAGKRFMLRSAMGRRKRKLWLDGQSDRSEAFSKRMATVLANVAHAEAVGKPHPCLWYRDPKLSNRTSSFLRS